MTVLAWIYFCFILVFYLVSLLNVLLPNSISSEGGMEKDDLLVSILIPVRNEETNLPKLLENLSKIEYSHCEFIFCDDDSNDRSFSILSAFASSNANTSIIQNKMLPEGWRGKNHACSLLAEKAKGDYYLFLDADVSIHPAFITRVINYADSKSLTLLSVFPFQNMNSYGEYFSVPIMNYVLLSLLPLPFVRWFSFSSMAAANGQCMLFKAEDYNAMQPHSIVRNSVVEDIEIARLVKKKGKKMSVHASDKGVQCRMYRNWEEAITGFSKNIVTFFGGSFIVAFVYWSVMAFGLVLVYLGLPQLIEITFLSILLTVVQVTYAGKQSIVRGIVCYPFQILTFLIILYKNRTGKILKSMTWKGRNIT